MTSLNDTPPPGAAAASTAVAGSLSTVGYAMFAWLHNGPLEEIPSLPEFVETIRREQADAAARAEAEAAEAAANTDTFGQADVDDTMGAVTPDTHIPPPLPTAQPVSASSVQVPVVPPVADPHAVAAAAADPADPENPPVQPVPKTPLGDLPEYTGAHTMQMLQEISFLEE